MTESTKVLTVSTGKKYHPVTTNVELNGVFADEDLTPKIARRAARVAFGHSEGVTVWDHAKGKGYRLYKNSARKLE